MKEELQDNNAMGRITPYILTKSNGINPLARELASMGCKSQQSGDFNIVYKDIRTDPSIDVSELTNELRESFELLETVDEKIYEPHVLVRESARGNYVDEEPCKYIVELTEKGPTVHDLSKMKSVPPLIGYGSLLDPYELACNTEDGDLRNLLGLEDKRKLAEEKHITEKISYAKISGLELGFNRAPTAKRHGPTQEIRNYLAVLNSGPKEGASAYAVIFDPADLTKNPIKYLAIENYGEIEYVRRLIKPDQIKVIGGNPKLSLDEGAWILESPLITDVDGKLEVIASNPYSEIPAGYIDMLTNGLTGAEQEVPGFAKLYVDSVIQPNGRPLSENGNFMGVLEQKLSARINTDAYADKMPYRAEFGV